ncbi:hypothetical protein [Hymenobacter elongatus]|uniref:Uncharacterized protein n=1 Tax=Hymenobacter elongatus TaxID=877208 RepID=A0A4Z0PG23_9BACT|nr:hypothetical protein [Hymenobacter elongatus]TGE14079.1 hypothetical protein E5J99_17650 [Hymenobacter elongatus]
MDITFDLNLDHTYAEELRQQHGSLKAQEVISELEDQIGSAINLVFQRTQVLPGVGDRVEVDSEWVVVNSRGFGQDGTIWLSVKRFVA